MRLPFVRFFGPSVSILGLLALAYFGVTKGFDFASLDEILVADGSGNPPANVSLVGVEKSPDTIRIASFNIQVFGRKKSANANVMHVLAKIVSQFDVVAIQEVKVPEVRAVDKLVNQINASGLRYQATVSKSLGRTSQTEQYAYVWDSQRIEAVPETAYVVEDGADLMHREPYVCSFRTVTNDPARGTPYTFTLINAHTDPDEVGHGDADDEMNVLDDVFLSVREYEYAVRREDDVILLGDLNVDVEHLAEMGAIPGIQSVTGPYPTNTAGTEMYDHILIDRTMTHEFTGTAGVVDYVEHLGLTAEQAMAVSDHRPVWAEFSIYEGGVAPSVAAASTAPQR